MHLTACIARCLLPHKNFLITTLIKIEAVYITAQAETI